MNRGGPEAPRAPATVEPEPLVEEVVTLDNTIEVSRQVVPINARNPAQGMRIVYPQDSISKGEAWNHLWHNPPTLNFKGQTYMPLFERMADGPEGAARTKNPYRKDHDGESWAWTVKKWVEGTPKNRIDLPSIEPRKQKTRYDLLMDEDWFSEKSGEMSGVYWRVEPSESDGDKVMASAMKIFEGLKILLKYKPDAEIDAQHDVLMAGGPEPAKLDDVDLKELEELGWCYDIKEEGWRRFT